MIPKTIKISGERLPQTPGVYLMRDAKGDILYIGKAGNIRRRVESYFSRPQESRIEALLEAVRSIEYRETRTAIEALVLEAKLIREHEPPFNVREKDDKSFLSVEITREPFPRILLVRSREPIRGTRYGPFTSASQIREALRILRKVFPWNTHPSSAAGTFSRPCLEYELGLCPGICIGAITKKEYLRTIRNLKRFFEGKTNEIERDLEQGMREASRRLDFERADRLKRERFALSHIQDVAFIGENEVAGEEEPPFRIEGYDISNISGTSAVGAMVVFDHRKPLKSEYRKFQIQSVVKSDDVGMLREVIRRRLLHQEWPLPDLILVDGGMGQMNAARRVLLEYGFKIPVVGIAKGRERKRNDLIGHIPEGVSEETLVKVRDEAHRFAIRYHTAVRSRAMISRK